MLLCRATSSPFQALKKFCRHLPRVPDMIQGEDVSSDIGIDISGLSSIRAVIIIFVSCVTLYAVIYYLKLWIGLPITTGKP